MKALPNMKFIGAIVLVSVAIFSRLIPHLPNLTAIGGAALLAGATLRPRWMAFAVPMLALLISDAVLGFYSGMIFNYLAWGLIVFAATYLAEKGWAYRLVGAFSASLLFFAISNFGVWFAGGLYSFTFSGLTECYVMALPFFATQILGDLLFTGALFFVYDRLSGLQSHSTAPNIA